MEPVFCIAIVFFPVTFALSLTVQHLIQNLKEKMLREGLIFDHPAYYYYFR